MFFLPFLPAALNWHLLPSSLPGPNLHGSCQDTKRTRQTTCTRSRKRNHKKKPHLEGGWSQRRLDPGTKLTRTFIPSFGSTRRLVNILCGHYKCLYFITCYTMISTTSTFPFPWYPQKYTFWRKRVPTRSYILWHCHHLAQANPPCCMQGRRQCYLTAPSWLCTTLWFKKGGVGGEGNWETSRKMEEQTKWNNKMKLWYWGDQLGTGVVLSSTSASVNKS